MGDNHAASGGSGRDGKGGGICLNRAEGSQYGGTYASCGTLLEVITLKF